MSRFSIERREFGYASQVHVVYRMQFKLSLLIACESCVFFSIMVNSLSSVKNVSCVGTSLCVCSKEKLNVYIYVCVCIRPVPSS